MGENSKIEWTDHTFNPWVGCDRISPACDHCYAAAWAARTGRNFEERNRTSPDNWTNPLIWNRKAHAEGRRSKVFCASLADVFDPKVPDSWRDDLFALIAVTQHLDWLLLTKRPSVARRYLTPASAELFISARMDPGWRDGDEPIAHLPLPNLWLGTTAESQAMADLRIPHLLATPAVKRFISCEPLLGPINLHRIHEGGPSPEGGRWDSWESCLSGKRFDPWSDGDIDGCPKLDWVICGGESGPHARPTHPDWVRGLRDQCQATGVRFFFKQWGEWRPAVDDELPERFGPECDAFRTMCSNGFVGSLSLESAFMHKPRAWPQCFPHGEDGDASCIGATMRRVGKKAAGHLLDGREHREVPA